MVGAHQKTRNLENGQTSEWAKMDKFSIDDFRLENFEYLKVSNGSLELCKIVATRKTICVSLESIDSMSLRYWNFWEFRWSRMIRNRFETTEMNGTEQSQPPKAKDESKMEAAKSDRPILFRCLSSWLTKPIFAFPIKKHARPDKRPEVDLKSRDKSPISGQAFGHVFEQEICNLTTDRLQP